MSSIKKLNEKVSAVFSNKKVDTCFSDKTYLFSKPKLLFIGETIVHEPHSISLK